MFKFKSCFKLFVIILIQLVLHISQDTNYGSIAQCKLLLDKVLAGDKVQQFMRILSEKNPHLYKIILDEVEKEIGIIKGSVI